jgi:hypothetical protein
MSKFSDFENGVVNGAKSLASSTLKDFLTQAEQDAKDFLQETAEKLERWTGMLAAGDLTKLEFTALVDSQKGLATLDALTHLGISAATLQRFRDGLVELVINTAFKVFLPM